MSEIKRRAKPELITRGKQQVSSNGRFNPDLMANYISETGHDKWIKVGELAIRAYGQNLKPSRQSTRRALPRLFWLLFQRGALLIYEYGEHGRIEAVKICDINAEHDKQCAQKKLERMKFRKEMTADQYTKAMLLLGRDPQFTQVNSINEP